jgi:hypothetical protein
MGRVQHALRRAAVALDLDACHTGMAGKPHRDEAGIRIAGNRQSDGRDCCLAVLTSENQRPKPQPEALNIVHDTNKTIAIISERGPKNHIAHLPFRHGHPHLLPRREIYVAVAWIFC